MAELKELVLKVLKSKSIMREEGQSLTQEGRNLQEHKSVPQPQLGINPIEGVVLEEDESVRKTMLKRVELLCFNGSNPDGWVASAEQFFYVYDMRAEMKIPLSMVSMEGTTLHWFRWLRKKNTYLTWEHFSVEIFKRFCDLSSANPYEFLASLNKKGLLKNI